MTGRLFSPVVALMVVAAFLGCSRPDGAKNRQGQPPSETRVDGASERVENEISGSPSRGSGAALGQRLRKLHETADAATTAEERAAAGADLLALYESLSAENSPHLISVRQDLAARAAQLLLATSPARSRDAAKAGLRLSSAPSVLRANLFLALADAEEALENPEEAKNALVFALSINEELFESEINTP